MSDALHFRSLVELAALFRRGELSPVEVTRAQLERIERLDGALHGYLSVLPEAALAEARAAEREIAAGRQRGPLHGVPLAVKDLCDTKGVRTTCASKIRAEHVPESDATVVERLGAAGAVLLGKLNMAEFAFSGYHPELPVPVNPWNAERWPGVSSSGSAVATAAGLCFAALGTDTGGSIRFPAAACGVVGLKPSYGRVSRHGIFPLAESLDHVGPFTRRTADAAAVLAAIAGHDPRDPTSLRAPVPDYARSLEEGVRGLCIGVDEDLCRDGVDPALADAVLEAAAVLEKLGAELRSVRVPDSRDATRAWWPICACEALLVHEPTWPERAADYGEGVRGLLERASALRGSDYARAHRARALWNARLAALFEEIDLFVCPSIPGPAPTLEELARSAAGEGGARSFQRFTAPYDLSGSPTLSLPCGPGPDGVPLSLQLVGRHLAEDALLRAGHAYESATDWHRLHPPV